MDEATSGQVSYIRVLDTLLTAGRTDLIQLIKDKDWSVFVQLYEIYPKLLSIEVGSGTGDAELEEDTRNLAHHDLYNLAKFTYQIVPVDRNDVSRVIRMVISSIQIPEDVSARAQVETELLGLAEISKFSQTLSIMDVDMEKINAVEWETKPYRYPIEFCMDVLYDNAEDMMGQLDQMIKAIDFDAILNSLPEGSDSESDSE